MRTGHLRGRFRDDFCEIRLDNAQAGANSACTVAQNVVLQERSQLGVGQGWTGHRSHCTPPGSCRAAVPCDRQQRNSCSEDRQKLATLGQHRHILLLPVVRNRYEQERQRVGAD